MATDLRHLSKNELLGICAAHGIRGVHRGLTSQQILDIFDGYEEEVLLPEDALRRDLMDFIEKNKRKLVLECNGNCFEHSWAQTLQCHLQLSKENE